MKHSRRILLVGFIALFFSRLFSNMVVLGQETDSVDIQWRVPREQVSTVKEGLNFDGKISGDESTIEDTKGLPLIYIFVGVVAVFELARTLLEVYRDVKYGGIVVHQENGKVVIDNDPRFSSGTIIVIQEDEITVFQDQNQPQLTEVINAIQPLVKK